MPAGAKLDGLVAGVSLAMVHRSLTAAFAEASLETPALDARWLIAGVLGLDRAAVLLAPEQVLSESQAQALRSAALRRLAREPVARILGRREFHGLELEVSPATLDPRPDTETLVDGVLRLVQSGTCSGGERPRIVDAGTGTGAILIALLKALPAARGIAVDIDEEALAVAARNASRHGVADRMEIKRGNWLGGVAGPFDIVVANPPYIVHAELAGLAPEVVRFDPPRALDGGADGLDAYRAIVPRALAVLAPGGWLALEIGQGQEADVLAIVNQSERSEIAGERQSWRDLGGCTRCVAIQAQVSEQSKKPLGIGR